MTNFLDQFTKVHRLPSTFRQALRYATRSRVTAPVDHEGPGRPLPIADTMFILKYGKKAWKVLRNRASA